MSARPPILASAAIALSVAALVVGLLLLNGGLLLTRSGRAWFEGLCLAGGALGVAAIIRHRPQPAWYGAAAAFGLAALVLAVMVRYQLGCAEQGACF